MTFFDRLLTIALRASLHPAERECVVGDLVEGHANAVQAIGTRAADAWYRRQILRSILPNLLRRVRTPRPSAPKGDPVLATIVQDARHAVRALRKAPAVTLAAALSLALGIGATTAVFSVIYGVMLRPLTYPEAERLTLLSERTANGDPMSVAWPNFQDWARDQRVFAALGIYRMSTANLTGGDRPERLQVAYASSGMFAAAGIEPRLGRRLLGQEDIPGAPRSAVISERLLRQRFAGDEAIVGREIVLNGERHTIVGVMPETMRFPSRAVDVWLPFGSIAGQLPPSRGAHPNLWAVGRLKPEIDRRQAQEEMTAIAARLGEQYPDTNRGNGIAVDSFYEAVVRNVRPALYVLLAAVSCVLLIACANVANLLLARGERRRREIAVRAALGATRLRIVRLLLTEHVLLAVVSGALGLAIAYAGLGVLVASAPSFVPRLDQIGIDKTVLAFSALASIGTGLLIGIAPALRASGWSIAASVKDTGRGRSRSANALQSGLVVAQVALALVLLASAGLLMRSFSRLIAVDLGFSTDNLVTMRVDLPRAKYPETTHWTVFHERLLASVAGLPGIAHAAVTSNVPLGGSGSEGSVIAGGRPVPGPNERPTSCTFQSVSPDYFAALGMPLLKGRSFTPTDREGSPLVAVVDETLVETFFPGEDPVGKQISFEFLGKAADPQPIWREIVGVVPHVRYYTVTARSPRVQVYVPYTQLPLWNRDRRPGLMLVAKTLLRPESVAASVRATAASLDPDLPVYGVTTMTQFVDQQIEQPRFTAVLLGAFSAVALILAAVGIYGVLSYSVSTRTQEMGVRMALGAASGDILRLVLRQGLALTAIGAVIGIAGVVGAGRLIRDQLFGVSPFDPAGVGVVLLILASVAVLATYIPARRSTRIDPVTALRTE